MLLYYIITSERRQMISILEYYLFNFFFADIQLHHSRSFFFCFITIFTYKFACVYVLYSKIFSIQSICLFIISINDATARFSLILFDVI